MCPVQAAPAHLGRRRDEGLGRVRRRRRRRCLADIVAGLEHQSNELDGGKSNNLHNKVIVAKPRKPQSIGAKKTKEQERSCTFSETKFFWNPGKITKCRYQSN